MTIQRDRIAIAVGASRSTVLGTIWIHIGASRRGGVLRLLPARASKPPMTDDSTTKRWFVNEVLPLERDLVRFVAGRGYGRQDLCLDPVDEDRDSRACALRCCEV